MVERGGKGGSGDLPLLGGSRILGSEIVELASRSSGPGGQHVNTSSTRVTLRWNLRESHGIGHVVPGGVNTATPREPKVFGSAPPDAFATAA